MNKILEKYPPENRENLIPILREIQLCDGYLTAESIRQIGIYLNIPVNQIYSVTSFYDQFRFLAKGRYHIKVCGGTACYIDGTNAILHEIEKALAIKDGETTKDGLFSLEVVNCLGACSLSPIMVINDQHFTKLNPSQVSHIIDEYRKR